MNCTEERNGWHNEENERRWESAKKRRQAATPCWYWWESKRVLSLSLRRGAKRNTINGM